MVKKFIIILIISVCILLNASFVIGSEDEGTDDSDEVEPGAEADYENAHNHKKVFEPNGNFIAGSSEVKVYKEPKEPEDEKIEVTVIVGENEYPCFLGLGRDVEVNAQVNGYSVQYSKNNRMWSISREVVVETRHSEVNLGFEWGNDGRIITTFDEIPVRRHCNGSLTGLDDEDKGKNENEGEIEDESEDGSKNGSSDNANEDEPLYKNSYQIKREIGDPKQPIGYFKATSSVEIYEEPQESNNTDGLVIKAGIDWNEPLYYMGSIKYASVTYNGYSVTVYKDGPDACGNQHSAMEINMRHGSVKLHKGFESGIYPNVYL